MLGHIYIVLDHIFSVHRDSFQFEVIQIIDIYDVACHYLYSLSKGAMETSRGVTCVWSERSDPYPIFILYCQNKSTIFAPTFTELKIGQQMGFCWGNDKQNI